MALNAVAEDYFRNMNSLSSKIHDDILEAKNSYENIWDTLNEKEKIEIINETLIKPEITLKYAVLDTLDYDFTEIPIRKDDLMSFFGQNRGRKIIQDDNGGSWRDEHSAPFLYQTESQLNLCTLSDNRPSKVAPVSPPPVLSELAMSHSKVVSELKNALKSTAAKNQSQVTSPTGFLKIINKFKPKEDDEECLMPNKPSHNAVENYFRTFKSPQTENKFEKDYRTSMVKSSSDVSEENRGLLSNTSLNSSGTEFQSCEDLEMKTESTETLTVTKTGFDFLDNW